LTAPATDLAKHYDGWNTALKPAIEDWWLFRAPLSERTIAANVCAHGTGALNIGACRVGTEGASRKVASEQRDKSAGCYGDGLNGGGGERNLPFGRWPANLVLSEDPEVRACFPEVHGAGKARDGSEAIVSEHYEASSYQLPPDRRMRRLVDSGSAARFFTQCPDDDAEDAAARRILYCGKATRRDRDEGCEAIPARKKNEVYGDGMSTATKVDPKLHTQAGMEARPLRHNTHNTVKPTALMRHLVRLVTPPGGTICDPFMGSGSTGKAAMLEGFRFVGIEQDAEYIEIARCRIQHAKRTFLENKKV
jgi:site-specific DNA-methyltransferase (adenine-specific)